jgi:hypothetical protein
MVEVTLFKYIHHIRAEPCRPSCGTTHFRPIIIRLLSLSFHLYVVMIFVDGAFKKERKKGRHPKKDKSYRLYYYQYNVDYYEGFVCICTEDADDDVA